MKIEAKVHYSERKKDQPQEETREVLLPLKPINTAQKSQIRTVGFDTKVYFDLARFAF